MAAAGGKAILGHERIDAWDEYLQTTRNQGEARYDEVERWAWNRLQAQLRAIDTRARALSAKARDDHDEDDGA